MILLTCVATTLASAAAQTPSPPNEPPRNSASFAYVLSVDVGWADSNWVDAEATCNEHGFYLARILSQHDQDLMLYKLNGFRDGLEAGFYTGNPTPDCPSWPCGMWFGANDRDEEGEWKWSNGILLSHYGFGGVDSSTNYTAGVAPWGGISAGSSDNEPNDYKAADNNFEGEDCARLDLQHSTGLWNDYKCDAVNPFVCELPLEDNDWRGGFLAQSPSPPPVSPFPPASPGNTWSPSVPPGNSPEPSPPPPPVPQPPEPSPPPPVGFRPELHHAPATPPPPPFDWLPIAIAGGVIALLLFVVLVLYYCTDLPKILAPGTRKKRPEVENLGDFMVRDDADMADLDPELQLNPVMMAKLEAEREARGLPKKGGGRGKNGALAKLGLRISEAQGGGPNAPAGKQGMLKQLDKMIMKPEKPSGGQVTPAAASVIASSAAPGAMMARRESRGAKAVPAEKTPIAELSASAEDDGL